MPSVEGLSELKRKLCHREHITSVEDCDRALLPTLEHASLVHSHSGVHHEALVGGATGNSSPHIPSWGIGDHHTSSSSSVVSETQNTAEQTKHAVIYIGLVVVVYVIVILWLVSANFRSAAAAAAKASARRGGKLLPRRFHPNQNSSFSGGGDSSSLLSSAGGSAASSESSVFRPSFNSAIISNPFHRSSNTNAAFFDDDDEEVDDVEDDDVLIDDDYDYQDFTGGEITIEDIGTSNGFWRSINNVAAVNGQGIYGDGADDELDIGGAGPEALLVIHDDNPSKFGKGKSRATTHFEEDLQGDPV